MLLTVNDLLETVAISTPDKDAVVFGNSTLSYARVYERSQSLARALFSFGVRKGDRVCLFLEKRWEKVVSIFAITMIGAVFVPIRRLSSVGQARYIIEDSDAVALITTSSRLVSLGNCAQKLKAVIIVDDHYESSNGTGCLVVGWKNAVADQSSRFVYPKSYAQDIAAILYTSGSTGMPKGVILSHQNIVAGARIVSEYLEISSEDRILSILSFGFDYGLNQLMSAFLNSAQLVLFEYLFPRDILRAVSSNRITGLAAVSTTWLQLLQVPWDNKMTSLRYITNSGGAIPVSLVKDLQQRIPQAKIFLMYGLTEAFRSTFLEPEMVSQRPSSIGKAVPGEEIMVLGEDDRPVEPGKVGELVHRGSLVARGYWKDPELTAKVFRRNPLQQPGVTIDDFVVYSGDYVREDEEGFLYFEGRRDEMIKCAGNRISPTEIEEILYASDFVAEVVALGRPHEIYGQVVIVALSLRPDRSILKEDIAAYCQRSMPAYMVPREIYILDELPVNDNGKLDRAKIKKLLGGVHGE